MGANPAFDFSAEPAAQDDAENPVGELYAAVQSMRANAVRMRAVAENVNRDGPEPLFPPREPDYVREFARLQAEHADFAPANVFDEFDRPEFHRPSPAGAPQSPSEAPAPANDTPAFPRPRHLDAAAEHIEHGRLPDLNALAALMLDMRSAQRAYELNLQMMDATHAMMARTVDLLRR